MSRPAPSLPRTLSLALCALALFLVGVSPVKGDIGRNGGIIILPCATHSSSWGKDVRATFGFRAGEDMAFQLDPRLSSVVLLADTGAGTVPLGTVVGHVLTIRSADVRQLKSAGVEELRLRVLDLNSFGYDLSFAVSASGDITVRLH